MVIDTLFPILKIEDLRLHNLMSLISFKLRNSLNKFSSLSEFVAQWHNGGAIRPIISQNQTTN